MANFNKVLLMGNITRDPELKQLANQSVVCEFGLAVNRTWTGADGIKKEETTFVDCNAWGKQAEILQKYRKKGDPIFVEGRLKLDQWEAQDGTKRSRLRVVVENFQFLNRSQGAGAGGYGGNQSDPGEYAGEAPAAPARQPYRAAGRPNAGPPRQAAPAPAAYEADVPSMPEDEGAPIKEDDIPF